jgi:hypothetical protein
LPAVSVPVAEGSIRTVTWKLPLDAGASVPTTQVTVPEAPTAGVVHDRPGAERDSKYVLAGVVKSTVAPLMAPVPPFSYWSE